jgi:hypothetical protein
LIRTFFVTIIIEGAVIIAYSHWHKKPVRAILSASLGINLVTQSFLWIGLQIFFRHYLLTLLIGEVLVCVMESFLLYALLSNRLGFKQAVLLSLSMNMASFTLGWFLAV